MPQNDTGVRLVAGVDASVADRLPVVAAVIVLAFAIFFVRLFQLQVIEGEDLGNRARRNFVRTVRLEASRGDIVDRFGRELATTRPAFGVQVMPAELSKSELTYAALGDLLEVEPAVLSDRVGKPRGRLRFAAVRLDDDLAYDTRTRIESHLYALPGVFTDVTPRRFYVGGDLAAHLLGYIGEVQPNQLEKRAFADYRAGEVIGQGGVESRFQPALRGHAGGRNVVVDVAGRVDEILDEVDAKKGGTVVLTIDRDLQQAAEAAFLPEVLGGPRKRGAVVAMDARNGDILAMVSRPAFDPNSTSREGWTRPPGRQLTEDEARPLQDRALGGPVSARFDLQGRSLAAAGLEADGVIDPTRESLLPGHASSSEGAPIAVGNAAATVAVEPARRARTQSCDVYFYQLGLKLGIDRIGVTSRSAFQFRPASTGISDRQRRWPVWFRPGPGRSGASARSG